MNISSLKHNKIRNKSFAKLAIKLSEETSELNQVLMKHIFYQRYDKQIKAEIKDVKLMIEQIERILG